MEGDDSGDEFFNMETGDWEPEPGTIQAVSTPHEKYTADMRDTSPRRDVQVMTKASTVSQGTDSGDEASDLTNELEREMRTVQQSLTPDEQAGTDTKASSVSKNAQVKPVSSTAFQGADRTFLFSFTSLLLLTWMPANSFHFFVAKSHQLI